MALSATMPEDSKPELLSSPRHTITLVLILVLVTLHGFHLQHMPVRKMGEAESAVLNRQAIILAVTVLFEWLLVFYIWFGVRWRAGAFSKLILGQNRTWKSIAVNLVIAVPFWFVWAHVAVWAGHLVGPSHGRQGPLMIPPEGALNIGLYFAASFTAGFVEELIYRGYLQKQLQAFSGSVSVAVVGQAVLFGFCHSYQGMKAVFVISILGLLYGLLAAWRKSLLPGIVSHAWSDIYAGYVRFL